MISSDSYPTLNIEFTLHSLAGINVFEKFDLKSANHQIQIDANFKDITTINTSIGLLRYTRMSYDIKITSAIFQRGIEKTLLDNIKNKIVYQNDICLGVATQDDVNLNTMIVLDLLKEAGLTINSEKWISNSTNIGASMAVWLRSSVRNHVIMGSTPLRGTLGKCFLL